MTFHARLVALALTLCLFSTGLPGPEVTIASGNSAAQTEEDGLSFRLSSGSEQPETRPETKVAATEELSSSDTEKILRRLPPFTATKEPQFSLRDRSLPPPRTGVVIKTSFPRNEEAPRPEDTTGGPLKVLRHSPEGAVELAPELSVTFSQPMVAVTSQDEVATTLPIKLSPQPPGEWRWVGTRTAVFRPEGRFPMATTYSVVVPAGTRGTNGDALSAQHAWSFTTPPPTVKTTYPGKDEVQRRDALMFVAFDQRINAQQVLNSIKVRAGLRQLPIRLATTAEIESNEEVRKLVSSAQKDRWLAFRAIDAAKKTDNAFPAGSTINVTIGPGTPSDEGRLRTTAPQAFSFKTFGPLRVAGKECYSNCEQTSSFDIQFSNQIDEDSFDKSQVRVVPALDDFEVNLYGSEISINGLKRVGTYRVILSPSIKDTFGQTLGDSSPVVFNVTPSEPSLSASGDETVVLDPNGPPSFSVYSVNNQQLEVKLYSVTTDLWPLFVKSRNDDAQFQKLLTRISDRLLFSKLVSTHSPTGEMVQTKIDLTPGLRNGLGQMVLVVEPSPRRKSSDSDNNVRVWIQRTNIGLDVFADRTNLVAWTTSLKDGSPLNNVQVGFEQDGPTTSTDPSGIAKLPLNVSALAEKVLVARQGNDVALLSVTSEYLTNQAQRRVSDQLRWFVFDDRKIYKPGEEVHIKGWIRQIDPGKLGDVDWRQGSITNVAYTLKDSRGNQVKVGTIPVNKYGGFATVFKLPDNINLGYTSLQLQALTSTSGNTHTHAFDVQEFRRPEYEVSTKLETEAPHFVGGGADVSVNASYYAGGGLANAAVRWNVSASPASFTPPNRDDFTFGKWQPWWVHSYWRGAYRHKDLSATTDSSGKHVLHIDFDSTSIPQPYNISADATVTDVNRQAWTSSTKLLVHPAELYVGLRTPRVFVQKGEPLVVESLVTDLDGKAITGRAIAMRASLIDWKHVKDEWEEIETEPQDCLLTSTADSGKCSFVAAKGGQYRVRAMIVDDRGRKNQSELRLWVSGGEQAPNRDIAEDSLELIPNRREYGSGDVAEILVQTPFYPAEGVMTLRRSGLLRTERFTVSGPMHTLRVPIEEAWTPNVHVGVDLVGAAPRDSATARLRPAFASGSISLSIPPVKRRLNVVASPKDVALEPGGNTTIDVQVTDATGNAVRDGEVAVFVVDESVLALSEYKLGDPISTFYQNRSEDVSSYHLRSDVVLAEDGPAVEGGGGPGGGGSGGLSRGRLPASPSATPMAMLESSSPQGFFSFHKSDVANPIRLREYFNALAVFLPSARTDVNGRVAVPVKLPDSLTRYRVMAVAAYGANQFGTTEAAITARLPLMVRPSAPRFLNYGDQFELPVVLQNQTDESLTVDVVARATTIALSTTTDGAISSAGRRVSVPANDRVEVRFPATAERVGKARIQFAAASGQHSDASDVSLQVWTPATTESFATYGELDADTIAQPVRAPSDVFKEFGGLEVETSSTQLQQLTDAVIYLTSYPYECSEQLASRILAIAALRDFLPAFNAKELPSPAELNAAVVRDIQRLQALQNPDGGFGFWRRGEKSSPFVSLHVAYALRRAQAKKFAVPDGLMNHSWRYVIGIEKQIPKDYSPRTRNTLIAYGLHIRSYIGDNDVARARRLLTEAAPNDLSLEALGWLLPVVSGSAESAELIKRRLTNRVTETAATAHFATSYDDEDYLVLNSSRRADGIILDALIAHSPNSDLIPKVVRGLLANRQRGRWLNTQENVFILLALERYFRTYEKVTPNFVARVWLGNAYAGEQKFQGRSNDRQLVSVPMEAFNGDSQNLIVSKDGPGRLYYRIAMNYSPRKLVLESADYGFAIERTYEAVDDAGDVKRDQDGSWLIKPGARVRVRLTMVAPARRYHVALVDPLPAGFEPLNPALAVTENVPPDKKQTGVGEVGSRSFGVNWRRWRPVWFDHQNMRDERVEAFTSLLWEGVYTYSYVARATTPGTFVVPPAKAEEMYQPETFGRTRTDRVVIKER